MSRRGEPGYRTFLCCSAFAECEECLVRLIPGETVQSKPPMNEPGHWCWKNMRCYPNCVQATKDRAARVEPYPEVDLSPKTIDFHNHFPNVLCCVCRGWIEEGDLMTAVRRDAPKRLYQVIWHDKHHASCNLPVYPTPTRIPVRQNVPVAALEVEEEGDDDAAAVVKKEENSALVAATKAEPKEAERGDVGVKREKGSGAATSKVKKKGSGDAVTDDKRPSAPRITKRERRREDCKDKAVKVEVGGGKRGGGYDPPILLGSGPARPANHMSRRRRCWRLERRLLMRRLPWPPRLR